MSKKLIILLSIFIVILLFIVLYLFYKSNEVIIQDTITTPTPIAEIKSEKFKSDSLGFEITLPISLKTEEKTEGKVVIIGNKILVYELTKDPEKCKGVCSILTKKEDITINNIKMRYLEGYWEELGEDNAQSFVSFVIPRDDKFLVFMLQELPIESEFIKDRKVGVISDLDLNGFKKMIESVILF